LPARLPAGIDLAPSLSKRAEREIMFDKGVPAAPRFNGVPRKDTYQESQFIDVLTPGWWLRQLSLDL
jgi:hypothetical protein